MQDVISSQPKLKSAHFCAETGKKVFKYGYHGYKNIDMLYLSNSARQEMVTIIHR